MHTVTFVTPSGNEVETRVAEDEYLIVAASRAGLELPSNCLQGSCLTCACELLYGTVESGIDASEAIHYYDEDAETNFVLVCSSYPRSDIKLLTHQSEAMREHREKHDLPAPTT